MAENESERLSAVEAVRTLQEIEGYGERLTLRAGAITWMVFGLAAAGIFATYTAIVPYLNAIGMQWLLFAAWAPWILAAGFVTNKLWNLLVVIVPSHNHSDYRVWWYTLGGVLLFYVVMGLFFAVGNRLGLDGAGPPWAPGVQFRFLGPAGWSIVVGTFTILLAVYQSIRFEAPALRMPLVTAGVVLIFVGIGLGFSALHLAAQGVLVTFAVLAAYLIAAGRVYRRG